MNHPAQDLAGLAQQILGHSLVVFLSHHDEAYQAAPDNARALIAEMTTLSAQRLTAATDEELRRRREVLGERVDIRLAAEVGSEGCRSHLGIQRGEALGPARDADDVPSAGPQGPHRRLADPRTRPGHHSTPRRHAPTLPVRSAADCDVTFPGRC